MRLIICTFCFAPIFANNSYGGEEEFRVQIRKRTADEQNAKIIEEEVLINSQRTAVIVCDVWDAHHCLNAVRRVEEMVPTMNKFIEQARKQGALIIHAPSDCMKSYAGTPGRKLAQNAPPAKNLPKDIGKWCYRIPIEEKAKYPIDQSDGGEDDDPKEHAEWHEKLKAKGLNPKAPWKKQHAGITIDAKDAISDSGVEIWNLLETEKRGVVIILGVHTNMCVLGRPFGLRQMAKNGKQVFLVRDLTDTMYNPKMAPFVSHFEGTQLIIEYIEKYICSTFTSNMILKEGKEFRFKGDTTPRK
ncbi:MAG: isochorismatase family protein [Zavarzinella sp.]